MAEKGSVRRKRGKGKSSLQSVVADVETFLGEKKKKKRRQTFFHHWKNPITGLRTTHCKYRPRPSKQRVVNVDEECGYSPGANEVPEIHSEQLDNENLSNVINECAALLEKISPPPRNNWDERMCNLSESWSKSRSKLLQALLEVECPLPGSKCYMCREREPSLRCHDCGLQMLLCSICDDKIHLNKPFHDREIFHDGFFKPIPPTLSVDQDGNLNSKNSCFPPNPSLGACSLCSAVGSLHPLPVDDKCIVVTAEGRFDLNICNIQCNVCHRVFSSLELSRLVKQGYWPGTVVNTRYIFTQDVLRKWDLLQKRLPGSSESGFLRCLEDFSVLRGRVGVINDTAFRNAFREWKFCSYEIDLLQFKDFMVCPTCAVYQHSVHVDGNAKLYRYKSAGRRKQNCYYGEVFILDNSKVDAHLASVYNNAKQSETSESRCGDSQWQAARNSLKKKKHLDETGLTISGCRHAIAQRAVNMFYGEVYGYAHYIQVVDMIPRNVSFFWEDVACRYWPWLCKKDPVSASKMRPALSVMHSKAHSWSCQVLWGGWWQDGAARSTGEEVEQINSYISRCGSTTKHMTPEAREEQLTDHIIAWNARKIANLAHALSKRYLKVVKDAEDHMKDFQALIDDFGVDVGSIDLDKWTSDVREHAKSLEKRSSTSCSSTDEQAVFEICQKMEYLSFSINQRLRNIQRLADTSKQRHRIRRKITEEKTELGYLISQYNGLPSTAVAVELSEVLDNSFPWTSPAHNFDTPVRVKRQVVEKYLEGKRLKEEKHLLKKEMTGFLQYYKDTVIPGIESSHASLTAVLHDLEKESSCAEDSVPPAFTSGKVSARYDCANTDARWVRGKIALAQKGLYFAKAQIHRGVQLFTAASKGDYSQFLAGMGEEGYVDHSHLETLSDDEGTEWEDVLEELSNDLQDETPVSLLPICFVDGDVYTWMFPPDFCQSSIDGRNGSNACSIISLAVAHSFLTMDVDLPHSRELPCHWTKLIYLCMRLGNALYDNVRVSLPHRYLTAAEAGHLFADYSSVEIAQPYPVRLVDKHSPSTIKHQLHEMIAKKKRCAALFIHDSKTVTFLVSANGSIFVVDSHSHPPYGAAVILANSCNLVFLSSFQKIAELHSDTFGNLTHVQVEN